MNRDLVTLRRHGWRVAVHNDYTVNGEFFTFWLFTHKNSGQYVKGEAESDAGALAICRSAAGLIGDDGA